MSKNESEAESTGGEHPLPLASAERERRLRVLEENRAAELPVTASDHAEYLSLLVWRGDYGRARSWAETMAKRFPQDVHCAYQFSRFLSLENERDGIEFYRDFVKNRARSVYAHSWLSNLYSDIGAHELSMLTVEDVCQTAPRIDDLLGNFVFSSMCAENIDPRDVLQRLRRAVRRQFGVQKPYRAPVSKRPRYIVGFVCSSLFKHAISYFLEPLLRGLDRKLFMLVVFSTGGKVDHFTDALRRLPDLWYDVDKLNDSQLLELIRSERVDVLIDLDNHTRPNRLAVFAARAAPIQMSFYGFNTSTGVDEVDYRLTDFVTDPDGFEDHYSERLLRTDGCHFRYWELGDFPPPSAPPIERNGFLTFGSFNASGKLRPDQVRRWVEILRDHPDSRLLIVGIEDGISKLRIERWLLQAGCDLGRVTLEGRVGIAEFRKLVQSVDLALDSYPFGGAVTTAATLRLGVPLATSLGPRAVCRPSASILKELGMMQFVAPDADALPAAVKSLSLAELSGIRSQLVAQFPQKMGSPERVGAQVGMLIVRAIERYRAGKAAEHDSC